MNIECQTIHVPTGGRIIGPRCTAASPRSSYGWTASPVSRSRRPQGARTENRAGVHGRVRGIQARTTGRSQNGTSTAIWTSSTASSRIRDTAVAMRAALTPRTGDESAADRHRGTTEAAGARVTTTDYRGPDSRAPRRPERRPPRCVFGAAVRILFLGLCPGPPSARSAIAGALAEGGARVLDYRIETDGLQSWNPGYRAQFSAR